MAPEKSPEGPKENSDKALQCRSCDHPLAAANQGSGLWAAVTKAKTPINVFALAMMAGASVFGYSATKVQGGESLKAFTYSLHTFLAVVGMFFLTLLFSRSAIYHPNEVKDSSAAFGPDKPGVAAGLIMIMLTAYGLYQVFASLPQK